MEIRNAEGDKLAQANVQNLKAARLDNLNLQGAQLGGIDCSGASFRSCNLAGADLRDANLGGADFRGANLTGAQLCYAQMFWSDFEGADLTGTDLSTSNLSDGFWEGVKSLTGANLSGSIINWTHTPLICEILRQAAAGSDDPTLLGALVHAIDRDGPARLLEIYTWQGDAGTWARATLAPYNGLDTGYTFLQRAVASTLSREMRGNTHKAA